MKNESKRLVLFTKKLQQKQQTTLISTKSYKQTISNSTKTNYEKGNAGTPHGKPGFTNDVKWKRNPCKWG